jgi:carboxypeptidase C (cathepsin A)
MTLRAVLRRRTALATTYAFFAAPLEPLLLGGLEAGQVKKSGLLTFVQIEAAGHMVPMDQAAASRG